MQWRFADLAVASDVPFPDLPRATGAPAIDVRRGEIAGDGWSPVQTWAGEDGGGDWLIIERGARGYRLRFDGLTASISPDGAFVMYEPAAGSSRDIVVHLLLHQVIPLAVSRLGRMVVHACAVETDAGVAALVGGSGAGKSTLAAAFCARGARLVADDALVVDPAGPVVWPTADGLRLWDDMAVSMSAGAPAGRPGEKRRVAAPLASGRAPLARLVLVGETSDGETRIERVTPAEARVALLPHLFRLDVADTEESRRLFDAVHLLATAVPTCRLVFPDGVAHLDAAVDAVMGDLHGR